MSTFILVFDKWSLARNVDLMGVKKELTWQV